jgi:hypothetical protein
MNGLTAANVEYLVDLIKTYIESAQNAHRFAAENQFKNVLTSIKQMQKENVPQPSRPDRVGDECWYFAWCKGISSPSYVWKRGILRAWAAGDCPAIVEDIQTKEIDYFSRISFSTEAPA